jgi:hypothetical protein
VFFPTRSQLHVEPQRLDLSRPGCADRIVAREPGAATEFRKLEHLWVEPEVLQRFKR